MTDLEKHSDYLDIFIVGFLHKMCPNLNRSIEKLSLNDRLFIPKGNVEPRNRTFMSIFDILINSDPLRRKVIDT